MTVATVRTRPTALTLLLATLAAAFWALPTPAQVPPENDTAIEDVQDQAEELAWREIRDLLLQVDLAPRRDHAALDQLEASCLTYLRDHLGRDPQRTDRALATLVLLAHTSGRAEAMLVRFATLREQAAADPPARPDVLDSIDYYRARILLDVGTPATLPEAATLADALLARTEDPAWRATLWELRGEVYRAAGEASVGLQRFRNRATMLDEDYADALARVEARRRGEGEEGLILAAQRSALVREEWRAVRTEAARCAYRLAEFETVLAILAPLLGADLDYESRIQTRFLRARALVRLHRFDDARTEAARLGRAGVFIRETVDALAPEGDAAAQEGPWTPPEAPWVMLETAAPEDETPVEWPLPDIVRNRITLVVFWTTWSPAYHRLEREVLRPLWERYGRHPGFQLVAVGLTWDGETGVRQARYATEHALPWSLYHDHQGAAAAAFGIEAVPQLLLLDPLGRVRFKGYGGVVAEDIEMLLAQALAGTPAAATPDATLAVGRGLLNAAGLSTDHAAFAAADLAGMIQALGSADRRVLLGQILAALLLEPASPRRNALRHLRDAVAESLSR